MRFSELKEKLQDFTVFSLADIRNIEPDFHRSRLNEWQNKGYIKKIRRGYYFFSDEKLSEEALFLIANRLYVPSYVSLEMALSRYGLIPESVYSVTSVTSKKTNSFKTPIATFSYRSVKPKLMFGYELLPFRNRKYKMANMEKSVLDYLYFHPNINDMSSFEELRFHRKLFLQEANMEKFAKYAKAFENKNMMQRLDVFLHFLRQNQ